MAVDRMDPTQPGEATTDDDRQQPTMLDEEDLFRRLKNWFQQSRDASSDWRKAAREDYGFYSGEQWDLMDKARLMEQLRPVITFNRIAATIDTVAGMEVNNRQEIRCYPRVAGTSSQSGPPASQSSSVPASGGILGAAPSLPTQQNANGSMATSSGGANQPLPMGATSTNQNSIPGGTQGGTPMALPPGPPQQTEAAASEQITDAIKWVRDECDAEDEESEAFIDSVICGMGWTETRLDYETDPDGVIDEDRIDPLSMYWDSFAQKRNLTDARYVMHRTEMDLQTARNMFPDVDDEDLHASWAVDDGLAQEPQDATEDRFYRDDGQMPAGMTSRRKCTIVHAQWYEKEAFYRVADPLSREMKSLSVKEYKLARDRAEQLLGIPLKGVKQTRRTYKRAFLGRKVLEVGDAPCKWKFTFQAITGKRDRNKKLFYGIISNMKDPQRWANKFFSTIIHNIASQGKGIIAERGAFEDDDTAQADWAHPDRIVFTKPGAIVGQKLMPKPQGTFPTGLPDMLQFALSSLRDVSGINLEIMGQQSNDQAAALEWQRRKSAFSILAGYFDALRHYRKEQGRLLIYLVQEYISDGRLMRITTDNGEPQYVPLNRSPKFVEYDVIVDDAPSSPDQKEATWQILGSLMPLLAKLPIPLNVWTEIIKQSPLPDSFSTKIAMLLTNNAQQGPPPNPEMIKVQGELQLKQQAMQQEQQVKAAETAADQQVEATRAQNDILETQASAQLQRQKVEGELELARWRTAEELKLERERLEAETELKRETENRRIDVDANAKGVTAPKPKRGTLMGPDPVLLGIEKLANAHRDSMKAHTEALAQVLSRPKKVVYGPNGRPSGVE